MHTWWLLWLGFIVMFIAPVVVYGWGVRKWGPPVPRIVQKRRAVSAGGVARSTAVNHYAWGWAGDLVWFTLFVSLLWAVLALFWH